MAGETLSAPDDADFEEAISTRSRTINVALIGNPNSGKTSLFNAISGGHEHVGNYSGVTVDAKRGEYRYGGYRLSLIHICQRARHGRPGLYFAVQPLPLDRPEHRTGRRRIVEAGDGSRHGGGRRGAARRRGCSVERYVARREQ